MRPGRRPSVEQGASRDSGQQLSRVSPGLRLAVEQGESGLRLAVEQGASFS